MVMAIEQAIRVENPRRPFAGLKQRLFKGFLAAVNSKYIVAIIATIQNVVDRTRILYT